MARAIAGTTIFERFTVTDGGTNAAADSDRIAVIFHQASLKSAAGTEFIPGTQARVLDDGDVEIEVAIPLDAAGKDLDVKIEVEVDGLTSLLTHNLGIVEGPSRDQEILDAIAAIGTGATGDLPDPADVRDGVDRGDGVLGTGGEFGVDENSENLKYRSVKRVSGTSIQVFTSEQQLITVLPVDCEGDPIDVSGSSLTVTVEYRGEVIETIENDNIEKTETSYSFTTSAANAKEGSKIWSCRTESDVIGHGDYLVTYAAGSNA